MIEDDGYETIVPDLSAVKVEQVDRDAAGQCARYFGHDFTACEIESGEADICKLTEIVAHHRQAAYNQALKDAAALSRKSRNYDDDLHRRAGAMTCGERISSAILSLGDKGNG